MFDKVLIMPTVRNMPGIQRVQNMPKKFLNMSNYVWIGLNMPEYTGICVTMPKSA